jgi:hypothetical protein
MIRLIGALILDQKELGPKPNSLALEDFHAVYASKHGSEDYGLGYPPPPASVNNPLVFIGLGGGRRCKRMIPWNLLTEILESITYSVLCRAEFPTSITQQLGMAGAAFLGTSSRLSCWGGFLVGILWGNWVGFPIWEFGLRTPKKG